MLTALFLSSCKESLKQENTETTSTEQVADDIVTSTSTDADGYKLEMTFNNTKGTATLNFKGETIKLVAEKSASGIWYTNEHYELRGKGNDIELKKDGELVFIHNDAIITTSLKNKEGQTLDMTINNTTNTAKVYLDGGEQIDLKGQTLDLTFNNTTNEVKAYLDGGDQIELVGQKPASGIWYKNEHYELRGKGNNLELKKDGELVFKN